MDPDAGKVQGPWKLRGYRKPWSAYFCLRKPQKGVSRATVRLQIEEANPQLENSIPRTPLKEWE